MMRRFVSLFCVLITILISLASPVFAVDEINGNFFNVLEYSSANNSGNNSITFNGSSDTIYGLPYVGTYNYVDMVISVAGAIPNYAAIETGGVYNELTVEHINGYLYRVYGHIRAVSYSYFNVVFRTGSEGTSWVTIERFEVANFDYIHTDIEAYCEIFSAEYTGTIHFVPTDEINHRIFMSTDDYKSNFFTCYIWTEEWDKFDYLDFQLLFQVFEITSVNCVMGSENIPLDVSYIDGTNVDGNIYFASFSVDLAGLDRSVDDYPMITVEGRLDLDAPNSIDFVNCMGMVEYKHISFWSFYIQRIISSISNLNSKIDSQTSQIVSAIRGDTTPGNNFSSEVADKDSQLKDMAAVMDSVSKPDIDGIDVNVNEYVDSQVLASSMSGLSTVAAAPIFSDVLLMAILLATAGYVLYGKR